MPWLLWIGGAAVVGWTLKKGGDAAEGAADLAKWGAVAGGVYAAYRIAQAQGWAK